MPQKSHWDGSIDEAPSCRYYCEAGGEGSRVAGAACRALAGVHKQTNTQQACTSAAQLLQATGRARLRRAQLLRVTSLRQRKGREERSWSTHAAAEVTAAGEMPAKPGLPTSAFTASPTIVVPRLAVSLLPAAMASAMAPARRAAAAETTAERCASHQLALRRRVRCSQTSQMHAFGWRSRLGGDRSSTRMAGTRSGGQGTSYDLGSKLARWARGSVASQNVKCGEGGARGGTSMIAARSLELYMSCTLLGHPARARWV